MDHEIETLKSILGNFNLMKNAMIMRSNQLLGISISWTVRKNSISWIRSHEKMNFDLMRFDLMIISQIICTVLYIYSCCYNYENKKAFDRIQVIRKPEWKISSKWNVSSKWNNVEFKASAGC